MKLYLDNCCYSRPFDDQTQDRIHIESEAVLAILRACENGSVTIFSSPVLRMEIDKFPNEDKREKVLFLYSLANPEIHQGAGGRVAVKVEHSAHGQPSCRHGGGWQGGFYAHD